MFREGKPVRIEGFVGLSALGRLLALEWRRGKFLAELAWEMIKFNGSRKQADEGFYFLYD